MQPALSAIWLFPIKSCRGISLTEARVAERGILLDRSFMIVDEHGVMVTQRTVPELCHVGVEWDGAERLQINIPNEGPRHVSASGATDGEVLPAEVWGEVIAARDQGDAVAGALSRFLRQRVRLVRFPDDGWRQTPGAESPASFADAFSFLGISESSLAALNSRLHQAIDMRRFRPNLVFAGTEPFAEDRWRGIRIGDVQFKGGRLCSRCSIPSTNPDTAIIEPEPAATLAGFRRGRHLSNKPTERVPSGATIYFGRNFSHLGKGKIAVGDPVVVESLDA